MINSILISKFHERLNHLGKVQVVISDKRVAVCDEYLAVERFEAEVLSAVDYYPFGMMMPDRQWYANSDSSAYSFGFGGQMKDDEVSGVGNSYTAEYWQYDPRLGKRFNIDPKGLFDESPYACFGNNPLIFTDPYGDSVKFSTAAGAGGTTTADGVKAFNPTEEERIKILLDLSKSTGYSFVTNNETGVLDIARDDNGQPIINKDENGNSIGSRRARKLIFRAIEADHMITVYSTTSGGTSTGFSDNLMDGVNIYMNFNQIQQLSDNSVGIPKGVVSPAMIFLHEVYHGVTQKRDSGGSINRQLFRGPVVRYMNTIERQLGYPTRKSYVHVVSQGGNVTAYNVFSIMDKIRLLLGMSPKYKYTYLSSSKMR